MGANFQVYRAAVNAAKGIRRFQKADDAIDVVRRKRLCTGITTS